MDRVGKFTFYSASATEEESQTPTSDEAHKNEGFLKAAWHKLTHQHNNLPPHEVENQTRSEEKGEEEEPKKAAGSG